MPEVVTLEFTIPSELGNSEEIIAELRQRVEAIERATKLERAGARVLGTRMILKQSWQASPPPNDGKEDRNSIRPRFAGRRDALGEALNSFREFLRSYRDARVLWLEGKACVFPAGTYWMARFTPASKAGATAN